MKQHHNPAQSLLEAPCQAKPPTPSGGGPCGVASSAAGFPCKGRLEHEKKGHADHDEGPHPPLIWWSPAPSRAQKRTTSTSVRLLHLIRMLSRFHLLLDASGQPHRCTAVSISRLSKPNTLLQQTQTFSSQPSPVPSPSMDHEQLNYNQYHPNVP